MSEISSEDLKKARDLKRASIFLILINMYILIIDYIQLGSFTKLFGFVLDKNRTVGFEGEVYNVLSEYGVADAGDAVIQEISPDTSGVPSADTGDGVNNKYQRGGDVDGESSAVESLKEFGSKVKDRITDTKASQWKYYLHFGLTIAALGCLIQASVLENNSHIYDYLITPIFWSLSIALAINLIWQPSEPLRRIITLVVLLTASIALTVVATNNLANMDEQNHPPPTPSTPSTPSA